MTVIESVGQRNSLLPNDILVYHSRTATKAQIKGLKHSSM